jgi:hypothetical protein
MPDLAAERRTHRAAAAPVVRASMSMVPPHHHAGRHARRGRPRVQHGSFPACKHGSIAPPFAARARVRTRRTRVAPPTPPVDDDGPLPVRVVPPPTAQDEADAWDRLAAALAWLRRQGPMDA